MDLVYNVEIKSRIAEKNKEIAQQELAIEKNESRIQSKNFLIGAISSGFIFICVVMVLLYRNAKHKERLQRENLYRLQQDMKINQLNAMIAGEEKERSRIARELHDGMGGTLATIRLELSSIARKQKDGTAYENVLQLLEEASADLRSSAHNLMPEILLQEGLVKAVDLFCYRIQQAGTIDINFEPVGEIPQLDKSFSLPVYRIIQELVNNIIKHANATQALVQINYHDHHLSITIEDNGRGIDTQHTNGMGLKTISERIHSLDGSMYINS
jgi:two-component system NarL family sensor kinase